MTKDELMEDVRVGDIVKIYTEAGEIFGGKIVDFGESGLKVSIINTNKIKRIMYGRIMEYDIEESDEVIPSSNEAVIKEKIEIREQRLKDNVEERGQEVNIDETIEENRSDIINRNTIFGEIKVEVDLTAVRDEWLSKLDEKQKKEYLRITNILDYAKKVHEYDLGSDRVKRAITEYKKIASEVKIMNVFIALIYHEFNDVRTAIEYYHKGGAYDVEFQLALRYGYKEELFEKAILAVEYNNENVSVVKWLCEYAVKNNSFAVISHILNHSNSCMGRALIYWYIDKPEFHMIPDKKDLFSNDNINYLKSLNSVSDVDSDTHIKTILSNAVSNETDLFNEAVEIQEVVYKGTISYYNKNGGNGMIKNIDGSSIYFYIKQVKDLELQRILATESNYKRNVTYITGINFRGQIAADAIELDDEELGENTEVEYKYEGYFDDYDTIERRGKIRSNNNKLFNFIFDAIKDPLLYAEIMSRPYDVLDNLVVKFNTKDYKSKKTKKTSEIAYDICGVKKYSQKEIDELLLQRDVTKKEVNDWLGVNNERNVGYFRAVDYEPLKAIDSVVQQEASSEGIFIKPGLSTNNHTKSRSGEKEAVSILLDSNIENPFSNLKRDISGRKYFQEAHRYMVGRKNNNGEIVGVDLERAEELFIQSIKAMDQTSSSVANLVNIYIKQGGEYIIKGLQLLEEYGSLFPSEKLTNLRIQLIDKSGNVDALEKILLSAIPNCVKKITRRQYMTKIAGLYYKQEKWEMAIKWFQESIAYLDKNKSEFTQYQSLRNNNLRPLIIAKYLIGEKDEAIVLSKKFLQNVPDDQDIKSIVEGTFEFNKTNEILEDLELQHEDEFDDVTSSEISPYLNYKLQMVDLSSRFSKIAIVYEKLKDGRYTGNADDSNRAVQYINKNLLRKNKRGISADMRSEIFLGIARIISDSRENSNSSNEDKVALNEVKQYVARYARYAADVLVEKLATVDSIRFLYIQALRYLGDRDDGNIIAAINMLVASFFVDSAKLKDELHGMKNSVYNNSYYKMNCISTKDLLIASFMLQDKQDYVAVILKKIYDEESLRVKIIDSLNRMIGSDKNVIKDYYEFETVWKQAKGIYSNNVKQLDEEISASIKEYHMAESIRIHIQRIQEILNEELLWNQDELIIGNYLKLIALIGDTFEKYTVEEKIEGFRMAEMELAKLKGDIESSPTEFSYNHVYLKLDGLCFSIRRYFDELYQSSIPECNIFLSNNSVYVNEKTAEIAITFSNSEDKQDADAVEIKLKGSEGAAFIKCKKKFTSVRSGEEQDYLAVFALDDKVISEGQFEITVLMQYRYRDSVENIETTSISEVLPVNITDKENYIKIENKYNQIFRGSGVDVNTPELFKGRNDLIDSICASMSSSDGIMIKNRGIILWGQRRVGKNSVKDYLKEKIRSRYPEAYIIIELGSIGKCRNLKEVLITIINKTEDALMQDYPEIYEKLMDFGMKFSGYELEKTEVYMPPFSRFMDRLSNGLKKLGDKEKNIPLFFIDEFSYLYEWIEKGEINGKQFMRFWKSFIQDYGICSIIIAQDNIPVWKSRYENEFACMNHDNEITYLDYEGAKELICEPCQVNDKMLYTPDAVKLIYDWTKGSAYLIVIFCKYVIDYLNANYTEKATKTIVQLVFEKEFIEKKEMFKFDDFEPQIQDVANVGEEGDRVNSLNEELLKEIASETITSPQVRIQDLLFFSKHKEQAEKIFVRLKERKIIEVERDTYCSISMPLLKFYLLREQSLLDKEVLNKMIR